MEDGAVPPVFGTEALSSEGLPGDKGKGGDRKDKRRRSSLSRRVSFSVKAQVKVFQEGNHEVKKELATSRLIKPSAQMFANPTMPDR